MNQISDDDAMAIVAYLAALFGTLLIIIGLA